MTDRELFEKALKAMEHLHRTGDTQVFDLCYAPELIPALRERLAQPEQEPVAWIDESAIRWLADRKGKTSAHCTTQLSAARSCEQPMPIYTAPPQRKPLSDEEIEVLAKKHNGIYYDCDITFARAIEAAHGIKENT